MQEETHKKFWGTAFYASILYEKNKIKVGKEILNDYLTQNEISFRDLPDIYQSNLNILDKNGYTNLFKTGKGFVFLKVIKGSMFSEEYKVSHILMKTNPMENLKSLKEKFYKIKREASLFIL